MIPFSPPYINEKIEAEVLEALRSGWITTGPKTKLLEKEISQYIGVENVLCLNSATAALELALRWYGVGPGDEVIVPAYTYSATANVVVHCGATPVMVDVNENDFNININAIVNAISERTKVIMPVDFAGFPCDYDAINNLVNEISIQKKFRANTENQKKLNRILVLSDAAHSLGAKYKNKRTGALCDITCFSFHAVKNLTTAEGGAMCINLPAPFDNNEIYKSLYITSLHGQTKDALAKTVKGAWEYDIIEAGYKCNMPDIAAAIGLAQFREYESTILPRRKSIFEKYNSFFEKLDWCQLSPFHTNDKISSYHIFPIRIKQATLEQRNAIIQEIFNHDVSVNVHFKPLPLLSFYKNLNYKIENYPVAYNNFCTEISLPVYYGLSDEQVEIVCNAVQSSVSKILQN